VDLSSHGRERYAIRITTTTASSGTPIPANAWAASFDHGATWINCTVVNIDGLDYSTWLLAGDEAAQGTAVAVIGTSELIPLFRATDGSELVVDRGPVINLIRD